MGLGARHDDAASGAPQNVRAVLRDGGLGVVGVAVLWAPLGSPDVLTAQLWLAAGVVIVTGLRSMAPVATFVAVAILTSVGWLLGVTHDPFLLAAFSLYLVAARRGRRIVSVGVVLIGLILVAGLFLVDAGQGEAVRFVTFSGVALMAAWALGVQSRRVRESVALQERLRLSRDVHDVLSHSLGSIGVQAGVAAHVQSLDASTLRQTLRDIEQSSRAAVGELRILLSSMRGMEREASEPLAERVAMLAETAERAGMRLDAHVGSDVEALTDGEKSTAYRIAQEAVTNSIRHSGASRIEVTMERSGRELVVRVVDDGRGRDVASIDGLGLVGLRERVAMSGGQVAIGSWSAKPATGAAGFVVEARLPIQQFASEHE